MGMVQASETIFFFHACPAWQAIFCKMLIISLRRAFSVDRQIVYSTAWVLHMLWASAHVSSEACGGTIVQE
jgi:hypothetical protein